MRQPWTPCSSSSTGPSKRCGGAASIAAHGDGQLPTESSTLHFVQMKSKYLPQGNEGDPSGNVDFGWNLQKNVAA